MNDCKHETIIFKYNEAPHCFHCGLLKSTIESGDTTPIINKADDKSHDDISPDSWEQRFEKKWQKIVLYHMMDGTLAARVKSLISQEIEKARLQGREEGRHRIIRAEEKSRIVGLIEGMKSSREHEKDCIHFYSGMGECDCGKSGWNQALEELKKKI